MVCSSRRRRSRSTLLLLPQLLLGFPENDSYDSDNQVLHARHVSACSHILCSVVK